MHYSLIIYMQTHTNFDIEHCSDSCPAHLQFQLQSLERQQQHTEQLQQPAALQQHQLPGPGPSISFAPEAEPSPEAETSRKHKRGPVWKRKPLVMEQINELIDELDEIDGNIALQVATHSTLRLLVGVPGVLVQMFPGCWPVVYVCATHSLAYQPCACNNYGACGGFIREPHGCALQVYQHVKAVASSF